MVSPGVIGSAAPRAFVAPSLRLSGVHLPTVATARVHTCGITPNDVTHPGHAATFVWADLLTSVWRLGGIETVGCHNVTDVDVLTRAADLHGRGGRPVRAATGAGV